jgi:hypothetical protein
MIKEEPIECKKINGDNDIVKLNIDGDTSMSVAKSVLCSKLEQLISGEPLKIDGRVYIDRDPEIFKLVLSYLINK